MRIIRKQLLVLFATRKFICCNAARCKTVEDINPPACNPEELPDVALKDLCERVGYHYKSNPTRKQLVKGAQLCFMHSLTNVDDSSTPILSPMISEQLDEILEDMEEDVALEKVAVESLYEDYLDMMTETSFIDMSRHDRISYLLSKHDIDDVERKATIRELLLAELEGDYVPTPDEMRESLIDKITESLMEKLDEVKPTAEDKCETAADINPPECNIEDLKDEVLISICSWAGYHHKPNPTRKQLVKGARLCFKIQAIAPIDNFDGFSIQPLSPMISEQLDEILQYIENQVNEDVVLENAIIESLYLDYQDMMKDSRFFKTKRHAILSNLLSKRVVDDEEEWLTLRKSFLETFDEAELEQSNRLSYGPTPEEIAKLPKWEDRHEVISLGDWYVRAFQKEGKVITAQWSATSQTWTRPTKITELEYKNGDGMYWWNGINALEFVRKSIQYDHASVFRTGGAQSKNIPIGYNYGDDPYEIAKSAIDEYKLNEAYIYSIARLFQEAEEGIRQKTGVPPTKAKKRSVSRDKPSPEEIAKLPKWQLNKQIPGFYEGQIKMMQKDGSVVQTMWSATSQTWAEPIQFTESDFDRSDLEGWGGINVLDFLRTEIRHDHVLVFQVVNDGPLVLIGYNYGDDPHAVAQGVIDKYMLDEKDLDRVADSIIQQIERHGGRFTHPPKRSYYMTRVSDYIQEMKRKDYLVLGILAAVVYFGGVVIILMIKGEKTGENRQFTKKTVYVKSSATKRLNQGKRLNGILTRSGVQYIDFERKTGQPTAMYKIKSSNGEIYVPLNIKGREEAIEKAAVLIQEAVGIQNMDEEIELPPTNRKQATTAAPPVSLSAPTRITKKKKKESLSSTLWQSLYDIVGKKGSSDLLISVLVSVIYIIVYYQTLPKDCIDIGNPEMCKFFAHNGECEDGLDPFAALSGITRDNCRLSCNACYEGKGNLFRLKVVLTQFFATFIQMLLLCVVTRAICGSCSGQSFISTLRLNTTKAYQTATSHIRNKISCSSIAVIVVIYALLFCMVYFECALFHTDSKHLSCNVQTYEVFFVALLCLLTTFPVLLCFWPVAKYMQLTEAEIFVLGGLCFVFLFRFLFDFKGQFKFVANLLFALVLGVLILLWRRLHPLSFIARILRMPFEIYQAKTIKQTIYIKSSQSKNLGGNQEIINKSDVDNIQIHSAVGDNYIPIHIAGSRRSVQKAIELIQEAVGTEHVGTTKPSSTVSVHELASSTINDSEPQPIQEESSNTAESKLTRTHQASSTYTVPYNPAIPKKKLSKVEIVVFGGASFVFMFGIIFGFNGHSEFAAELFFLGAIIVLLWIPFDLYQTKMVNQTIYVKSSKAKELTGQQARKMKEILNKSSLDKLQIEPVVAGDSHRMMHVTGSRRNVREAIGLIQEAVGKENVSTTKPFGTSVQESASSKVNSSEAQPIQEESTTPESLVQAEAINDSGNNLTKEASTTESPPATAVQEEEEEVPSEIGIDLRQGMTRETITEASISSFNDRSNTSKAYSSFTLNENDPLLIFLRSQESCIKGSVEEFYTWLVKSEDIDSMMALKEAVNEDDYLNDMKVGDGGGSGIKGFKRKAFLRAILEYFNDESDAKPDDDESKSKAPLTTNLNEPPEELVCPISLNLMTNDPVLAADSITYERASIEDWFKKSKAKISKAEENLKLNPHSEADKRIVNNGVCSPVYGSKLESLVVTPNTSVRNMARAYKEKMSID